MRPAPPIQDLPLQWEGGAREVARLYVEPVSFCVLLVQPSFRPAMSHGFVDDETGMSPDAHELTVGGYARQALTGVRLVDDPAGAYLDGPDLVFGDLEAGERIRGAVLYRDAGSDRLSPVIAFYPYYNAATTGGPVLLEWAPPEQGRIFRLPRCYCGVDHHMRRSS